MFIMLIILVVFLFVGVPIAFSIGLACLVWLGIASDTSLLVFITRMFRSLNTFPLLAVPLFMMSGEFMNKGGIVEKLLKLAMMLVGSFKGGLAHINILVSMFFAGITGSAAADTSAIGSLLIPNMIKEGYEKDFSVAVTATSSVIGVIIPPSIPIVMAAIVSSTSIGALLLAGIIPGILMGLALMGVTYVIANQRNYRVHNKKFRIKDVLSAFIDAIPSLFVVVIIVGGIYSGIFTATESAAVAAFYTLFLGTVVYKKLKIKDLPKIFIEVAAIGGLAMFLLANCSVFAWIISSEQIPVKLAEFILASSSNKVVILLMIVGLSPVHFSLVAAVGLSIGLATPPVGVCLSIACGIADLSIDKTVKALIPYILAMLAVLILITFVPEIVMYIPRRVFPYL